MKSEAEEMKATQTVLEVVCRHRNRLADLMEEDDETIKHLRAMLNESKDELTLARKIVNESSPRPQSETPTEGQAIRSGDARPGEVG